MAAAESTAMERDRLRQRWVQARTRMSLADPMAEDFGSGGLGRFVDDPGVRLVILPPDPFANIVGFDPAFWEWWEEAGGNPFQGAAATNWGNVSIPTADAAVLHERAGNGRWNWQQYLAMHRSAAFGVRSRVARSRGMAGEE